MSDAAALQEIDVGGVRTRYLAGGAGPELLLLHGWGCSIDTMRGVFDDLAKNFSVTLPDLPGHGGSALPPGVWGVEEYTGWLEGFIGARGLGRPHILGHSVGGKFAIALAARHPELVGKLVLAASAGIKRRRPPSYYAKVALAKTGKLAARYLGTFGESLRKRIYDRIASPDYKNAGPLRATLVKIINTDIRALLPRVASKTLLIWGRNDDDTPLAAGEIMHGLIPSSELVVLENAGHYLYLDDPMKFSLHVKRFLRES